MRIFCDTSVLVSASVKALADHARAFPIIERVMKGADEGFIGMHTLAEIYSAMSGMPLNPRIPPGEVAALIKDSVLRYFKIQALSPADYATIIEKAAASGLTGGMIYDALLLGCAEKVKPQRIYTFNLGHFKRIAPHLAGIISAP